MIEQGLVDEVKALASMGATRDMVSMQGLGYKEILDYLDGKIGLEEAIYRIKRDSRHFAKHQLTWFRRERDVTWIHKEDFDMEEARILDYMLTKLP
jgi:tRNA dimethylallyltransferase